MYPEVVSTLNFQIETRLYLKQAIKLVDTRVGKLPNVVVEQKSYPYHIGIRFFMRGLSKF